jgi:hypothetical protein
MDALLNSREDVIGAVMLKVRSKFFTGSGDGILGDHCAGTLSDLYWLSLFAQA